jgi:hypothetical protein
VWFDGRAGELESAGIRRAAGTHSRVLAHLPSSRPGW